MQGLILTVVASATLSFVPRSLDRFEDRQSLIILQPGPRLISLTTPLPILYRPSAQYQAFRYRRTDVPYFIPCPFFASNMTYINPRDPRICSPNLSPTEPLICTGGCYCKKLTYTIRLKSREDARTTVCHCQDCKKTFGSAFGVTVKVPVTGVRMTGAKVMVRIVIS